MSSFEEYAGLGETGFESKETVSPEDEFFHALYIAGMTRSNHINVMEEEGKLQIRGVEYNQTSVNFVISHVKKILVKSLNTPDGDKVECFSFKSTPAPPWFGYNNRQCGDNSAARAADSFCNTCREQIIVAGIYCDESGNPKMGPDNKPIFIFLRGKGMKYNNVAQYLSDLYREDLDPLFAPITDNPAKERQRVDFEKKAVNNKRFVTNLGIGYADSAYGKKRVFTLEKGSALSNNDVMNILKISKQTLDKFNEKFDWSRSQSAQSYQPAQQQEVPKENIIPDSNTQKPVQEQKPQQSSPPQQKSQPQGGSFNFEDLDF